MCLGARGVIGLVGEKNKEKYSIVRVLIAFGDVNVVSLWFGNVLNPGNYVTVFVVYKV